MTDLKKEIKYLPVFIVLVCVYFNDVFLKGALLAVEDGFQYYYPMMIAMAKQYSDLIFPFWNPYEYSGFPLLAAHEPGALYPFNIFLPLVLEPSWAFNVNLMLHYAFAGFFTFLYARQIGLPVFSSLISGTVFSLLGYLPAHLNHQNVITAAAWVPLLLYCYEHLKNSLTMRYALYASLIIALQFLGGHPQICFYTYLLLTLWVLFSLFSMERAKRARFVLLFLFSLLLGLLLALPQIVATYELTALGVRAKTTYEFFASYSFPLHMVPTFLFPFFYYLGGSQSGEMWGTSPLIGQDAFIGTLPFLISLVVMVRWRKNPHILFWSIVAVLAFVMALGDSLRPLNRLLYHLPLYNAFRAHAKLMVLVSFALSIITGFGISFLEDREREKRFPSIMALVLSVVISASLLTFTVFADPLRDFIGNVFSHIQHFQIRWDRTKVPENALDLTDPSAYLPLIAMSLYLICILGIWRSKKKQTMVFFLSTISVILLAEAMSWKMGDIPAKEQVEDYNKELYSILASRPEGRSVFLTSDIPPLTAIPYGVPLADGYESLETGNYTKIFPRMYLQQPRTWRIVLENNVLLSMLHVRYIIVSNVIGGIDEIAHYVVQESGGRISPFPSRIENAPQAVLMPVYRKVAAFSSVSLYENLLAMPRAYPVARLKAVTSVDKLRLSIFSSGIDPWREAAVSPGDLREIGNREFAYGTVSLKESRSDALTLSTDFQEEGFVVLADQFYPGWEAYLDGIPTKIYRTNGVQRGVIVPEGEHSVEFRYVPRLIYASMAVSMMTFFVIAFVLIRGSLRQKTRR